MKKDKAFNENLKDKTKIVSDLRKNSDNKKKKLFQNLKGSDNFHKFGNYIADCPKLKYIDKSVFQEYN